MLVIKDLYVSIEGEPILKGFSLTINEGEIHAIMGPNGAGKSTLARVIAGDPAYEITGGELLYKGQDLQELDPCERAHLGLFMSFQYPIEIAGISNLEFLHSAFNAHRKARGEEMMSRDEFETWALQLIQEQGFKRELLYRDLNSGFSGGEKKQNEILQMALLGPAMAILDETDSGLDIDALRIVAEGVNRLMGPEKGLLLITHYQRLLNYIHPDFVHIMVEGKIVESGGPDLALRLEEKGYAHVGD